MKESIYSLMYVSCDLWPWSPGKPMPQASGQSLYIVDIDG